MAIMASPGDPADDCAQPLQSPESLGESGSHGIAPQPFIVAMAVEIVCLLLLAWLIVLRIRADIPLQASHAFETRPGFSVLARIDWPRLLGFICDGAVIVSLPVLSALVVWITSRRPIDPDNRPRLHVVRIAAVLCACLAFLEWISLIPATRAWHSYRAGEIGTPDRWQAVVVLAFGATAAMACTVLGIRVARRSSRKIGPARWALLTAVAAIVVAGAVADQTIAVRDSSYAYTSLLTSQPRGSILGIPVVQGFQMLALRQAPTTRLLSSVACGDDGTCMAFGIASSHRFLSDYPEIVISTNGGRTWQSWMYPALGLVPTSGAASCVARTCRAVVGGGSDSSAFLTATTMGVGPPAVHLAKGPYSGAVPRGFVPEGPMSCSSLTWCGVIAARCGCKRLGFFWTDDGGMTWKGPAVPLRGYDNSYPTGMSCPNEGHCIVTAVVVARDRSPRSMILVTVDSGRTWDDVLLRHGTNEIYSTSCVDATTCWVVAGTSPWSRLTPVELILSTDSGRSWREIRGPSLRGGDALLGSSCWSRRQCAMIAAPVTGAAATEYTTDDGGSTWVSRRAPRLDALTCRADGTCVGLDQAEMYVKDGGGHNWRRVRLPAPHFVASH